LKHNWPVVLHVQEEVEVGKAVEQMLAAMTTLNSVHASTPLPPTATEQLRDICRQIEMLLSG